MLAEARRTNEPLPTQIDTSLFETAQERDLFDALQRIPTGDITSRDDIETIMLELAWLAKPIDNFFEQVIVNHEDEAVRANRLALLNRIISQMGSVADFSKIER